MRSARAADRFWTNGSGGNFVNITNWGSSLAPSAADNANFTNGANYQVTWTNSATNANAFFNARSGAVTQAIGSFFWLLTNSYVVGQNAGSTAAVTHVSGALRVTNAAGTARMIIGQSGKATYLLTGSNASVLADEFFVTNVTASATNSVFGFASGTLTINRGSIIKTGEADFRIGSLTNQTAALNLLGGTNILDTGAGDTLLGNTNNSVSLVTVTGATTIWTNSGHLLIGNVSAGNSLVISNGGTVVNSNGYLGFSSTATNNQVIVTGPNSLWSNRGNLFVGNSGGGSLLLITNGGRVANAVTRIGFSVTANSNQIIVTGPGSLWTHSADLRIGAASSFNTLLIAAGGRVENTLSRIGFAAGANSNQVIVSGPGSLWTNSADLRLGQSGSFNLVLISNGGWVANTLGTLGENSDSSNNVVLVTGSGSVWSNADNLRVGQGGSFNTLRVTNSGTVFGSNDVLVGVNTTATNNLLLLSAGALLTNGGDGMIGVNTGANSNLASLSDINTRWLMGGGLYVGSNGAYNRLVISNGALVGNDSGTIGYGLASSNNEVVVSGAGSFWSNQVDLSVGFGGSGNRLVITNGGSVVAGRAVYLGQNSGSGDNLLTVSGSALIVTNPAGTAVYDIRRGTNILNAGLIEADQLVMTNTRGRFEFNGGTLITRGATISNGQDFVAGFNTAFPNATWDVRSNATPTTVNGQLIIGLDASNARLLITNGGTVNNLAGYLGYNSTASNNTATVGGANSVWNNSGNLFVGNQGSFNSLLLTTGGTVSAGNVFLGFEGGSTGNRMTASGGTLQVTNAGGTAALDLRRGTNVLNAGLIEADTLLLTNNAGFFIFNGGTLITRGSVVSNGADFVVGASGSTPAVWDMRAGPSSHSLAGNLLVGSNTSVNQLLITNGAVLTSSGNGLIGVNTGASSNSAFLSGANTRWLISSNLYAGSNGAFNRLVISNGAQVANLNGVIGSSASSAGNVASVTGAGSFWSNAQSLIVGNAGISNSLQVTAGGRVVAQDVEIGYAAGSNHSIIVNGPGSELTALGNLDVGAFSRSSLLMVTNGGLVSVVSNLVLGSNSVSLINLLRVAGGSVVVTNASGTGLLDVRGGQVERHQWFCDR